MLILDLLKYAASAVGSTNATSIASALHNTSEREFRWSIEAGLGPLLFSATRAGPGQVPKRWRDVLLSADLTAQVMHDCRTGTATEVIDACATLGAPVTLLKGISISDQCYPQGHLRPMSDIDVLVPADAYIEIESELLRRGFRRHTDERDDDSHHGIPLQDIERQVWVELHTALFPRSSGLRQGATFSNDNIAARTIPASLGGKPAHRFDADLQAVYIASSWNWDLTLCRIHPSFIIALFDAVYLQKAVRGALNWKDLPAWLDNDMAAASLHVMLSFLARHGLCNAPILDRLASAQTLVGRLELRAIHAMLDRYLLGGRAWGLFVPPPVPGRYNLRRQLRKRLSLQKLLRP